MVSIDMLMVLCMKVSGEAVRDIVKVHAHGPVYEGWNDDKKHGQGKYTYANAEVYEGGYKDDKKDGQGMYTYSNGQVYKGDWLNDKIHGYGKLTWPDGRVYDGEFVNNGYIIPLKDV